MNIAVCIKQVPDVPSIRMDRKRMTIIRDGVESVINPLDYVALQAALDLRDRKGGEVVVVTMGPPQSEEALGEAVAVGADRAILVTGSAFSGADTLATSHVLAAAISKLDTFPDLILCGTQTTDSDTAHVGPQIAEELNLPQVCGVNEIHVEDDYLTVKRLSDGFVETLQVSLPALLTVTHELCSVRHLPFGDIQGAFSKNEIIQWGPEELELKEEEVGLKGSATQVWRLSASPPRREGDIISGSPQTLVDHLIRKLEDLSILDEEDGYK